MERGGAAVTCDGRLFHRRAAATGNALSPTMDSGQTSIRRTSRDVDDAERSRRRRRPLDGRVRKHHDDVYENIAFFEIFCSPLLANDTTLQQPKLKYFWKKIFLLLLIASQQ